MSIETDSMILPVRVACYLKDDMVGFMDDAATDLFNMNSGNILSHLLLDSSSVRWRQFCCDAISVAGSSVSTS